MTKEELLIRRNEVKRIIKDLLQPMILEETERFNYSYGDESHDIYISREGMREVERRLINRKIDYDRQISKINKDENRN